MRPKSDPHFDPERKSKSQLKREATALQEIGERLVRLSDRHLSRIPMDTELREAVLEGRRLRSLGAYRRQLLHNARREQSSGRPPVSCRRLFRYLKELTRHDVYLTTNTSHSAPWMMACAVEPRYSPSPRRPWEPTTIRSTPCSFDSRTISCLAE